MLEALSQFIFRMQLYQNHGALMLIVLLIVLLVTPNLTVEDR